MYQTQPLSKMTAAQIVSAIRSEDLNIIRKLVKEGTTKGIWTQGELAEMLNVNQSTVNRWVNYEK